MKEEKEQEKKKNLSKGALVTIESIGAVGAIFSLLALFIAVTGLPGEFGKAAQGVLLGAFGYFVYVLLPVLFCLSVAAFLRKKCFSVKRVFVFVCVLFAFLIAHSAATYSWSGDGYLSACFKNAQNGFSHATPAGWLGGLICFLIAKLTGGMTGAVVTMSIVCALLVFVTACLFFGKSVFAAWKNRAKKTAAETPETTAQSTQYAQPMQGYQPQMQAQPAMQNEYAQPMPGYAPAQTQQSAQYAQPMQGYQPQMQGQAASTQAQPLRPEYVPMPAEVRRSTSVRLSDTPEKSAPTAFSPFGYPQQTAEPAPVEKIPTDREFLFGGNPAEQYRRNLIFDQNARVNTRPAFNPDQPTFAGNPAPMAGQTYTSAYETSVGNTGTTRPEMIVEDVTPTPAPTYVEPTPNYRTPIQSEPAFPAREESSAQYTAFEPQRGFEQPARTQGDDIYSIRDETEPTPSYSEHTANEPATQDASTRGAEPDYRSLFSPSNPNLFGGDRDRDDRGGEPLFSPARDVDGSSEPISDLFGDTFSREGGEARVGRTDSRDIFDEPATDFTASRDGRNTERSVGRAMPEDAAVSRGGRSDADLFEREEDDEPMARDRDFERFARGGEPSQPTKPDTQPRQVTPPAPPKPRVIRPYTSAPITFFDCSEVLPDANAAEVEQVKSTIIQTLDAFKVTDATIASVTYGPTVTRYNVAIPIHISPKKVVQLDQEIAMNLYAAAGVNIYPNFEDGAVSIEVPNKKRQFVTLGCMLADEAFINAKPNSLTFALGKDVGNKKTYGDIRKMTHLLVAGASGAGKSVFLHSLIISLIYKYSPKDLRMILIDPKKAEFILYDNLPHLIINEIISEPNKVIQALNWAIGEMTRRYTLIEKKSRSGTYVVNIDEYNANLAEGEEKLPKIVIIVDELADLMLAAKKEVEERIQNLAQKSRAAGIHLILTTQHPSADVITGVIKSNLKTRIAFSVANDTYSRIILDTSGAQTLLGMGDMMYLMEGMNTPVRVQSPFISSDAAQKIVNYIKENNDCDFDEAATAFINNSRPASEGGLDDGAEELVEQVYIEALRHVIQIGSASISMIQRKCSVGYNKAGRIIEWMEEMGYISTFDGAKARKVLITPEEFEEKYGPM